MHKKKLLIGSVVAIVIIFILINNVEFKKLNSLKENFNYVYLVFAFIILILGNLIRAVRFNYLLNYSFKFSEIFTITTYYNFYTAIFPGGIGELSFLHLIKKNIKQNIPHGLSSIFLTRFFDILLMTIFFAGALPIINIENLNKQKLGIMILIITVFILLVLRFHVILINKINYIFEGLSEKYKWALKIRDALKQTEEILIVNKKKSKVIFLLSFFYLGMIFFIVQLVFLSVGVKLNYFESILMGSISTLVTITPLNTIGGYGYKETGLTLGLIFLKIAKSEAIVFSFLFHTLFLFCNSLLALLGMAIVFVGKWFKTATLNPK
jgi:uncharacterized protein (TIRG00374 family)